MPPLLLDDEEAVAVAVGLRTAAGGAIAGIEDAALRALAKLEQVLPSRLRSRVGTLQSVITPVPVPGAPLVDPDVVLDTGSDSLETLAVYLGLLGYEFRVESPAELACHVRELADRYQRATR
jgi:predicted DNA-binding transcriptional regulator YafY